jgi:hypothetical protein
MRSSLKATVHRVLLCKLSRHGAGAKHQGSPESFCPYCGSSLKPWPRWEVTLRSGDVYQVEGINEQHAGSQVVYGGVRGRIDGRTGRVLDAVKIHRDNIASIRLLESSIN